MAHTFISPTAAAGIDRAEGRLCAGFAHDADARRSGARVFEVAGGVVVFAGAHSPVNKMVGVGYDGLPTSADFEEAESLFTRHGAPLQAEVSTLADPRLHAMLTARRYEPRGFENVLGCPLTHTQLHRPAIDVSLVEARDRDEHVDLLVDAWRWPDSGGVGGDAAPPSDDLRHWLRLSMSLPGVLAVVAHIDGKPAGGATLRIDGDIAQFCGAATLPAFRRRGVQTALLQWRLAHARALGCSMAIVTTQPASRSQQNVQREGFDLLYARQLLVKEPSPTA